MEEINPKESIETIRKSLESTNPAIREFVEDLNSSLSSNFPGAEINALLKNFLRSSNDPQEDYRQAHNLLSSVGLDVHDILAEVIDYSINSADDETLVLFPIAKATGEAPLLYLTAWNFFKCKHFQEAIDVCDSVENKLLDFELLKSECLLSNNQIEDACGILEDCSMIAPQDPFVLKKLARAYIASEKRGEAFEILKQTLDITEKDLEVSWMFLHLGTFKDENVPDYVQKIQKWVQNNLQTLNAPQELRLAAYKFMFANDSKDILAAFLDQLPWNHTRFIHEFLQEASLVLKGTHEKGWYDLSVKVTDLMQEKITND